MGNSPSTAFDSPAVAKGAARRSDRSARAGELHEAIEHATHYLPAQGPIKVFIHHNTLHAFEHLPFDEGVQAGGKLFGCQSYLPEDRYRELLASGRIRPDDLFVVLLDDLGDDADTLIGFLGTRFHFRLALLQYPPRVAPTAELRWFLVETDALSRMHEEVPPELRQRFLGEIRRWVLRDLRGGPTAPPGDQVDDNKHQPPAFLQGLFEQFGPASPGEWSEATWEAFALQALWRVSREGAHGLKIHPPPRAPGVRHRDSLVAATGADSDLLVHEVLIRYCAAFLDQGFSRWPLPDRDEGFFRTFLALYGQGSGLPDLWLEDLPPELARLAQSQVSPLESILESLHLLGVDEGEWQPFLTNTLLALRGWAGMIHQVEQRADSVEHPIPRGSLLEFLAVRLILERLALAWLAKDTLGYDGPLDGLRHAAGAAAPKPDAIGIDQRAYQVFHLAQVLGWLPQQLAVLSKTEWAALIAEIEAFPALQRRRIYHAAFERRYRVQTLDAIALHSRRPRDRVPAPPFQVICCLDEREESFRRHLEEVAPGVETFSTAGFFGAAIYYRGVADAHFVPLCPIVIRPQHWVVEEVVTTHAQAHLRRAQTRRALGTASHGLHVGSRTFLGGAVVAAGLGVLASVPLVARVLFPRLTARIRSLAGRLVAAPRSTELQLERTTAAPGPDPGQIGFSLEEMAAIVERMLRDIGLTAGLARLVFVVGHGSSSLNNPHESAHDCGACGGGRGGPNARAVARMANDPRVRERLAKNGLIVPAETVFVGAYHNTCDESLTYFDLDRLPESHAGDFAEARRVLDLTRERNAHERCRRFESAPLTLTPAAALEHVEARAEDLAQVRPEYGHATNAVCIVGRRSRTRGLYQDRRAFLTSYDPTQDDAERTILTRILQAVVPVCAGINLEYYFSFVDPTGYGCGTKLPHNITSLLGVMDGAASDLRSGLPWQMVEVHDPVRLLFVIETTPQAMLQIMERNATIGRLCRNGWVQLATLDPESSLIHCFHQGRFEPYRPETNELPAARSSVDWYRGWRDHLGYAQIKA